MIVTCAYCKRTIRGTGSADLVSHGVCHECLPFALDELQIPLEDYLEAVPYPAMLVDEHGNAVMANARYRSMIGTVSRVSIDPDVAVKEPDSQDSSGAKYKRTDTVKMVVRRAVETNSDLKQESARAELNHPDGRKRLNMLIGTMRFGDKVIVRVEDMDGISTRVASSSD